MIEGRDPTVGIFDNPAVGVCINQEWIPFIIGALEPLALPELWETDGPLAQVEALIALLAGPPDGDCSVITETCNSFDFTNPSGNFFLWAAVPDNHGATCSFSPGNGWFSQLLNLGPGAGDDYKAVVIRLLPTSPIDITHVRLEYEMVAGSAFAADNEVYVQVNGSGGPFHSFRTGATITSGHIVDEADVSFTGVTQIDVFCASDDVHPGDPTFGNVLLMGVTITTGPGEVIGPPCP